MKEKLIQYLNSQSNLQANQSSVVPSPTFMLPASHEEWNKADSSAEVKNDLLTRGVYNHFADPYIHYSLCSIYNLTMSTVYKRRALWYQRATTQEY